MATFGELTSGDCLRLSPPPPLINTNHPKPMRGGGGVVFAVSGRLLDNPGKLTYIRV